MRVCRWIASLLVPPTLRVLEVVEEADLSSSEERWIEYYREQGADLLNAPKGPPVAFRFSGPHTPEARAKIGLAHRGMKHSDEALAKIRAVHIGRKQSEEERARKSAALKGKPKSPETRARMAAAQAARTGWKHTPETHAKMSAAQKGRPWSKARREAQDAKAASNSAP